MMKAERRCESDLSESDNSGREADNKRRCRYGRSCCTPHCHFRHEGRAQQVEWLASYWQRLVNAFEVENGNKTQEPDRVKEDFKTEDFNKTNEDLERMRDLTSRTMEMQTVMEVVRKMVEKVHHLCSNAKRRCDRRCQS